MRILVFGHWSDTGFGVVTQELSQRFLALGHDVRVIAQNYRGNPLPPPMAGRVWPAGIKGDGTGGNVSQEAALGLLWPEYDPADHWIPEVALFIADAGTVIAWLGQTRLKLGLQNAWGAFEHLPTWNYVPIEGDNLAPSWKDIWLRMRPIAMSNYGQKLISQHVGYEVPMVYHGVDTDQFRPASPTRPISPSLEVTIRDRTQAKLLAGFDPDRYVVLRCDRLVERKQYHVLFEAMKLVWDQRQDVDLVIHCSPRGDGYNIYEEAARLPIEYVPYIKLIDAHDTWTGLDKESLTGLYNAADLYVSPTGGEGFGLTLAEALACETPVITTDYAAGPEVVGPGGVLVPPMMSADGRVVKVHARYGMDWAISDAIGTARAIMRLLDRPGQRRDLGRLGRAHVKRSFSWDIAAKQFLELFEQGGSAPDGSGSQDLPTDRSVGDEARRPDRELAASGSLVPGA